MSGAQYEIHNLRDFLVHLPKLTGYEYNNVVGYIVWKVLRLSLKFGNEIGWSSFVTIFDSENWHNGSYKETLKNVEWKKKFLETPNCNSHAGAVCDRICYPLETVYYCFTCTMNPLYEICEYCFDETKHVGHTYTAKIVFRQEGRVCHCGDTSIFKETMGQNSCKAGKDNEDTIVQSDCEYDEIMVLAINHLIDYLIDVTIYLKDQNESSLSAANLIPDRRISDTAVKGNTILTDSRGKILKDDIGGLKWALQIDAEDCNIHYMDLTAKLTRILNKPAEYAISLANSLADENFSVTVVETHDISKIQRVSEKLQQEGINNHIRSAKEIFIRKIIEDLIDWLYLLAITKNKGLSNKKSLRLSMLDAWNSGLQSNKFTPNFLSPYIPKLNLLGGFLVSYEQHETFPWFKPWNFVHIDDLQVSNIMNNYDKRLADTNVANTVSRFHPLHGSRFQYVLAEAMNVLSRASKFKMLKILSSLFTLADNTRRCLAAQYFDIYLNILYSTVASDSTGFKVSLMSIFSQYVFQHPDTANLAIKNSFIQRTLKFAFTLMAFTSEDLLAYLPIPLSHGCRLPNETIRNRRTIVCFKDICIIMSTNTVPLELLSNNDIMWAIIESFTAFNNILPLKREIEEHVEFENFDFSSYYFYFSSILVMVDGYIRCLSLICDKESRKTLFIKLITISMDYKLKLLARFRKSISLPFIVNHFSTDGGNSPSLPIIREKICNHVADIINFQVGVDIQNFFNPMSYMFKFILQWSQCGRYDSLPTHLENYIDFSEIFKDRKKSLYMCESAISTLVLLGQINVGFWVRNGTPITHQARMYTKYSMREFTYMSDIFNVQFSMSYADPDDFMVTYIARWGLKNWANGVPVGDYPHHETTVAIVYECILLLVQILTEIKSLTLVSSVDGFEKTLKAEIVHALCYKNCTYSQIMDAIPEHIIKHAAFDLYLEEYTNFIPPTGITDHGIYSLKPKYREEIDPYYVGLSPSRRYEVEKDIRNSMKSSKEMPYDDTFVPAKEVINLLKKTPYSHLYAISSVNVFGLFLKNTLDLINKFNYESLLPIAVHLIHQCVVNNLDNFMRIFWREFASVDTEFYYYNSIGSILYGILLKENFIQVHGKIREIFRYLSRTVPHIDIKSYLKEQTDSFNENVLWSSKEMSATKDDKFEKKKKLAKMRREKMLRELAEQQLQFIKNNSVLTEEADTGNCAIRSSESTKCVGWRYPEEYCVFCKMLQEEDAFVYFSYQETNIYDHATDFSKQDTFINCFSQTWNGKEAILMEDTKEKFDQPKSRIGSTMQGSVLRTCGHGAHVSCLGNHMKSIRAAHTQTTKNVPVAYGFGLMYCPLCNGLCNSFLPRILKDNARPEKRISHGISKTESTLLSTSIKAARIFEDLCRTNSHKNGAQFAALDSLFTNTLCNIELTMRSESDELYFDISNQKLLTLRLLNELICYLHQNTCVETLSNGLNFSSKQVFHDRIDTDMLIATYTTMKLSSVNNMVKTSTKGTDGKKIEEILKGKVLQDMLILAKELLKVGFYEPFLKAEKLPTQDNSKDLDDNYDVSSEVDRTITLFKEAVKLINPAGDKYMIYIHSLRYQIHYLLKTSLQIFVRRVCIMIYAHRVDKTKFKLFMDSTCDLNKFLFSFNLPNWSDILRCLEEQLPFEGLQKDFGLDSLPRMLKFATELESMNYSAPDPIRLVTLPYSLSHFFLSEEHNLMHKILRDDIAICLFCGKQCKLQMGVPLHGFGHGVCTNHVRNECKISGTYGVFLMIRSNAIYLAYGERGTFYSAPYLHKHGEPDEDFKYNTPVFLNHKRYNHLCNNVILDNMIPHIVLRLTDGNSDLGGWETM